MSHVVLDLETLGVAPDSAVMSIGAVSLGGSEFYAVIANPSGHIDQGTVRWWLGQRAEARQALLTGSNEREVIQEFSVWLSSLRQSSPLRLWGSEDFDTVILRSAYERNDLPVPWKYWEVRGLRTALELAGIDEDAIPWEGIEHIAIECARHAATALKQALKGDVA